MMLFGSKKIRITAFILIILIASVSILLMFSPDSGKRVRLMFSSACISQKQGTFSNRLTDRIVDYSRMAKLSGISECRDVKEINKNISEGKLVRVSSGRNYIVDRMSYSYPCLTPNGGELLDEIGRRFREKTNDAGLRGSKFIVTSMTRTTEKMKGLRKNNSNASANSPHLNGNAFDISYVRFKSRKLFITSCDKRFFKEALAQIIFELKTEKKCWATYEKNQSCFHVVAR
jgi:hypothetical protein